MSYITIVTDTEIARLLLDGIRLDGKDARKQYEAIKQLGEDLEVRVTNFRQNLEAALDYDTRSILTDVENKEILNVVIELVSQTINNTVFERGNNENRRTPLKTEIKYSCHIYQDGSVSMDIKALCYTGERRNGGQVISDEKHINRHVLGELKTILFNDYDNELYFKRKKGPKSTDLTQPMIKIDKAPPGSTHLIEAEFSSLTSMDVVKEIYVQHMQYKP